MGDVVDWCYWSVFSDGMDQKLGMGRPGLQADASGCIRLHGTALHSPHTAERSKRLEPPMEPLKFPLQGRFSFASIATLG